MSTQKPTTFVVECRLYTPAPASDWIILSDRAYNGGPLGMSYEEAKVELAKMVAREPGPGMDFRIRPRTY